jgi:hypothetical protein
MNLTNEKKRILIVSTQKKAALFISNTLISVFGDNLEISVYYSSLNNENLLKNHLSSPIDLIIASGKLSYEYILKFVNKEKVMIALKEISEPEHFDRLFLIPKGKKVLVVNETKNGTLETIQSLESLGITHLNYIPYWLNCGLKYKNVDIAISPGMIDLCPKNVEKKLILVCVNSPLYFLLIF